MEGKKILKATHEGKLKIGEKELPCAVLIGGARILTKSAVFRAFERTKRGRIKGEIRVHNMPELPSFIDANNLVPYIDSDLSELLKPITYKGLNGTIREGYKAEIIPQMCDVYLQARKDDALKKNQNKLAEISEIIVRSLSKVGITALIDEATGYQEIRDRNALQVILDKYLTDEWAKWTKRFPDEYYKELFKLNGLDYPPKNGKKCSYVGHWTNDIVYDRLVPGLKEELKKKNPLTNKGYRARKHHQYLTDDIGHPKLKEHLIQIIFLMKTCSTYREFRNRLGRVKPKYNETMALPMDI